MNAPILFNGKLESAQIEFVREPNFQFVKEWRSVLRNDKHPKRNDAFIFASLACKRFRSHYSLEKYAQRAEDIAEHIQNEERCEVAILALMKCEWFPESKTIGIAHFRRSWCNNIILDYLAAHPWIASRPPEYVNSVKGVGTALLFFISEIAARHGCNAVWGRATQNSCEAYKALFKLENVEDSLYISRDKYIAFVETIKKKWNLTT